MGLKEIAEFQKKFDAEHGWEWANPKDEKEFLKRLQHVAIALSGEQGEFSNVVKKILREFEHDGSTNPEHVKKLEDEITDVFIYVVVASLLLGIDLEKEYFRKMKINEERFQKFKNNK